MQSIYKIVGGSGGKCGCGHNQKKGDCYYLVDTQSRTYTLCQWCGKQQGLDNWWGTKRAMTSEEMSEHWFGAEPMKEVVCQRLGRYTKESKVSSTKEEMLRIAVDV